MPLSKLIDIPEKIVIFSVYQHQPNAIKNWKWSMKVSKAVNLFLDYHKMNSQKNTIRVYGSLLAKFREHFPERDLESITS